MSSDAPQGEQIVEKRRWPRYPFGITQRMATIVDGRLPRRDEFEQVQCLDLSRGGFLFYRPKPLGQDCLVIAFGEPPEEIYFAAKVVYSIRDERRGTAFYRIGCEFTSRLQPCGDSLIAKGDIDTAFALLTKAEEDPAP